MSNPAAALGQSCRNHPDVTTGLKFCSRCATELCASCLVDIQGLLTCASCKDDVLRDLRSGAAELSYAGAGRRLVAQIVDGLIIGVPLSIVMVIAVALIATAAPKSAGGGGGAALAAAFWLAMLVIIGAGVCYEALMLRDGGQTLGKKALGIKVVTPQGKEISTGQAWLRAGSRVLMSFIYVWIIDVLFIFSEKRRTLHDRIAQTVVVNWRP